MSHVFSSPPLDRVNYFGSVKKYLLRLSLIELKNKFN